MSDASAQTPPVGSPVPPAGPHGGDGARIAAALGLDPDEVLDLSASLNPFAPDVVGLAREHMTSLRRYPEVGEAERVTAELVGVDPGRTVLTAGGAQAIALVAEHLGEGWVEEPDFSLYRRHLPRVSPGAGRWCSDPHNPSGALAPEIGSRAVPGLGGEAADVAVWDEAFLPLSAGIWSRSRPGWALGSLTKAFACPGLRLGYVVAPTADEADHIRSRRPAWAVGGLACALLPRLAELADPAGWTRQVAAARSDLDKLLRYHGLDPQPSDAPWLLVPVQPHHVGQGLRDRLILQGVVVRDCASFGLPDVVRIAVTDEPGLDRLARALDRVSSTV